VNLAKETDSVEQLTHGAAAVFKENAETPHSATQEESASVLHLTSLIRSKQITVGVVGLGYVGLPLSLLFAESDITVLGFDIDKKKIEAIESGQSYIKHISNERLKKIRKKAKIQATTEFQEIEVCDVVIMCLPTPLDHYLQPELKYVIETCRVIGPHLKKHCLVSLESTTWPGTTEEVVKPILEKISGFFVGRDLYLCFSPEREDPGNKSFQTADIPKLIGAPDKKSLKIALELYSLVIKKLCPLSSTKTAELAKLFENIFRSVNIALVNELKIICDPMNIDVWEVIEAASTKPFGFMPFWPGPGLGGHCIPIDPFYLSWKAKQYGTPTRFIELAGEINRAMPKYVVSKIQDCLNQFSKPLKDSKVLILGLAYKSDIDDLRESPSLELLKLLEAKGCSADYYDPLITEIGLTREYRQFAGKKHSELSEKYDCFVLATHHSCFCKEAILGYGVPIVDTRNFFPRENRLVFPA